MLLLTLTLGTLTAVVAVVIHLQGGPGWGLACVLPFCATTALALFTVLCEV